MLNEPRKHKHSYCARLCSCRLLGAEYYIFIFLTSGSHLSVQFSSMKKGHIYIKQWQALKTPFVVVMMRFVAGRFTTTFVIRFKAHAREMHRT